MANFIEELKSALNSVVSLVKDEVIKINEDITAQTAVMQTAYDNIKSDREQLSQINEVVGGFVNDMSGTYEDTVDSEDSANEILDDCYDLIADGVLVDDDVVILDEEDYEDEDEDEQLEIDTSDTEVSEENVG